MEIRQIYFKCPGGHVESNQFIYPKTMENELKIGNQLFCRFHAVIEKDKRKTETDKKFQKFVSDLRTAGIKNDY